MKTLYILYDAKCGMCRNCRVWLDRQRGYVERIFIPLFAPDLEERFPGVGLLRPNEQLIVISDEGDVWRGVDAWIVCLWALREYRSWALRLANPLLKPFARKVCELVSTNRHGISRWFFRERDVVLAERLATETAGRVTHG